MKSLLLLWVLLLAVPSVLSQTVNHEPVDVPLGLETEQQWRLFQEARNAVLDGRLTEAEQQFQALEQRPSETVRVAGLYGRQYVALWRAIFREREPAPSVFYDANGRFKEAVEDLPDTDWKAFLLAEANLHRAVLYGWQQRFTKAALALHGACGKYREVADTLPEARLGLGLCQVAAGSVPSEYRWIARLFGFRGTVSEGLETLEIAEEEARFGEEEAGLLHAFLRGTLLSEEDAAVEESAGFFERLRSSAVVPYVHGMLLLDARRPVEAEEVFRRSIRLSEEEGYEPVTYSWNYLGFSLYRQNRFGEAVEAFQTYRSLHGGTALMAQATLHEGLALELAGDRDAAVARYEQVTKAREFDSDRAAVREAQMRLKAPLSDSERVMLLGAIAFDGGRYEEAVDLLRPVFTNHDEPETVRAEAAYRTARALHVTDELQDAARHYRFAIDRPGDPEARWRPWSLYYLAEIREEQGKIREARGLYEDILDIDEMIKYDYRQSLEQRTKAALSER